MSNIIHCHVNNIYEAKGNSPTLPLGWNLHIQLNN